MVTGFRYRSVNANIALCHLNSMLAIQLSHMSTVYTILMYKIMLIIGMIINYRSW